MPNSNKQVNYHRFSSYEVEPGVRCSSLCENGRLTSLPLAKDVTTVWKVFLHGHQVSPNGNCLGSRNGNEYSWWSYADTKHRVEKIANALKYQPDLTRQKTIGIYSIGCPNWIATALAAISRSLIVVPLYDTLGAEARTFIINQVEMSMIFVDSLAGLERLIQEANNTPSLKTIVTYGRKTTAEILNSAKKLGIRIIFIEDFVNEFSVASSETQFETGDESMFDPPTRDDLYTIMYTSGTTGNPKGVMHTHQSMVANYSAFESMFRGDLSPLMHFTKNEVCLLYLPLAHAYAQLAILWFLYHGAAIGFHSGDILKLVEDAAILKPTFMPLVPRLMNKLYTKVTTTVAESKVRSAIFWYCYKKKLALLQKGIISRSTLWDRIAFNKLQNLIGGRVWLMSVGSAPISPEILEFWRVCFGAIVAEGYGQTECAAAATISIDAVGGSVGHPVLCNLVKLCDVPECGYLTSEGKGEVCVKGSNVMKGYYKEPEKTAEVIDEDGWLHTGDIGQWLSNGALKIIDRKKHIFKLAQGEYIAPEKIEAIYQLCPLVSQVFVDGNSLQSFTVAVVVAEPESLKDWVQKNGLPESLSSSHPEFVKHLLSKMVAVGKANGLNSLEQVKSIYVSDQPFSADNGLLTPTMKNKRNELRRFYHDKIEELYKNGPM